MFVELHILQSFAPSNLNRDDTGAPKECEFGGYRRARISSQCIKRSTRKAFGGMIAEYDRGYRTKLLAERLAERLKRSPDDGQAARVINWALAGMGFNVEDGKTQYLIFLGDREVDALASVVRAHWETLAAVPGEPKKGKDSKKKNKAAVPEAVREALLRIMDGGKAADVALFGRMLADLPDKNIDAASQVAHALSTHRVGIEFDYYTAIDDLKPKEDPAADMLGTIEFNAACYYRYSNVDTKQLLHNLQGDRDLASRTLEAFLRASVQAVPTGKQNSMAAQNPPSFVMGIVRKTGVWNLSNAFLKPVVPDAKSDVMRKSIDSMKGLWSRLKAAYGGDSIVEESSLDLDLGQGTLDDLVKRTVGKVSWNGQA